MSHRSKLKSLANRLVLRIHPDKFHNLSSAKKVVPSLSHVQSTNAAALATMNEITSLLADMDPNRRARNSSTSSSSLSSSPVQKSQTLASSTFDLSFFVWNEPSNALDLKQVTLSFPSQPGRILKSAESQFDDLVKVAELKKKNSPSSPSAPTLPNGRRFSASNIVPSSSRPPPSRPRSAPSPSKRRHRSPEMTKSEMRKIKKQLNSAFDEMAEILSTGAHLDSILEKPKTFSSSSDPNQVSVKQSTIRQILQNVRQIPSSGSPNPEMSAPSMEILDRIASVFHHEIMFKRDEVHRVIDPKGNYVKTLRDILLQDGKKWRIFSEMLITVGPDDYDDVPLDEIPEDVTWFGWDFRFVDRPEELDDEHSTAARTDHKSFYKIFNAPVTSPNTLYVLIPPDFEKRDLLTFLESIFED
mmetsp:Transcript_5263/g.10519  ORF Transcript_5263/g.10519 Transcript_5263/m.10519 type:complete len:414 (-) Transcript_5263:33-1274(-)